MRFLIAWASVIAIAAGAEAHFVFVYVEAGEARLVFGHAAAPDPATFPTRAAKTTLTARSAKGDESKLITEKGNGNFYRAKLPAGESVVVFGTTEAGVTQRGENPPQLSWYYPKVIVGDPFQSGTDLEKAAAMEIVPVRDGERIRFKVLSEGKPLAEAEVTIMVPGKDDEELAPMKTNKEGLTAAFDSKGRYCVAARRAEEKAGEFEGKKYATVRYTASLVCDFGPKQK